MKLNISDWVKGKTKDGELIQGFIQSIDAVQGFATVYVVHSDNEDVKGKIVAVREHWLKKMQDLTLDDAQLVQNLIDMALATWDEAWFMELTETLKAIQNDSVQADDQSKPFPFYHNRLGPVSR